jgi:GGDEF domain-containing protein
MRRPPPRRRPARPVGDAPTEALLERREDLAKGWLIALLEELPLERAGEIFPAGGDFARDAPRLCEALVRALTDDDELRRIEVGGELEPLVSRAGEVLGARDAEAAARSVDALQAVIWSALRAELGDAEAGMVAAVAERLGLIGELARGAVLRALAPGRQWPAALEEEIARCARTGASVSLLLIELEDVDRLVAVSPAGEAAAIVERFARAVREVSSRQDVLACEGDARVWVIARETDRRGASALASRIDSAVSALPSWRGAPLTVEVGIAVLGEDAHDAAGMIEAAEVAKFAAQASGIQVSRARPEEPAPPGGGPQPVS